jgi:hypothetical protein
MKRPSRKLQLPPLPRKEPELDADGIRLLGHSVTTTQGRAQAHKMADYLEKLVEINAHNERVARDALGALREALGEVEA